ncbi:MAG: T9SS type A sorting domain-containing protein, partial [Bacteroidota bacterium]
FGNRTDLVIHRLRWEDYWQSDTVTTERIEFNYAEQTSFESALQMHPFDAEALLATNDALYLFTKDWTNFNESKVYRIPKEPSSYTIAAIDSISTTGLLTGLTYHEAEQKLLFVGYNLITAFVMELSTVDFNDLSTASVRIWNLPIEGSFKTEAISYQDERFAYVSKERNSMGDAALYRLDTDFTTKLEELRSEYTIRIFPNPASSGILNFEWSASDLGDHQQSPVFRLLDTQGRVVKRLSIPLGQLQNTWQVDVSDLAAGVYFYKLSSEEDVLKGKVVVE